MIRSLVFLSCGAFVTVLLLGASPVLAQKGPNFGNTCDLAESTHVDPIFEPDPGHAHNTFGIVGAANADDAASVRKKDESTCNRTKNKSLYWMPEIYENGERLEIYRGKGLGDNTIYYRRGAVDGDVAPFPRDFEMVARAKNGPGNVKWGCDDKNIELLEAPPKECASKRMLVRVTFPQCFDRQHTSDKSRKPENVTDPERGSCGKRKALPLISFSVSYKLDGRRVGEVKVAGSHGRGHEVRRSYKQMHADFLNGWDQERQKELVDSCINKVGEKTPTSRKPAKCRDPERTLPDTGGIPPKERETP